MPLTSKGNKILGALEKTYGNDKKAEQVLYAGKNKGTFTGIDCDTLSRIADGVERLSARFDSIIATDATREQFSGSLRQLGKTAFVPGADKGFHHIINAPSQAKKAAAIQHYGSTEWRHNHPEWKEPIRKAPLP